MSADTCGEQTDRPHRSAGVKVPLVDCDGCAIGYIIVRVLANFAKELTPVGFICMTSKLTLSEFAKPSTINHQVVCTEHSTGNEFLMLCDWLAIFP